MRLKNIDIKREKDQTTFHALVAQHLGIPSTLWKNDENCFKRLYLLPSNRNALSFPVSRDLNEK